MVNMFFNQMVMDRIRKIMFSSCMNDFLRKLFILFAILYILFFGAETVLPGIVMDGLNINIFLFLQSCCL